MVSSEYLVLLFFSLKSEDSIPQMKNFSQAADRNKLPILKVLSEWLITEARILEVGSGSGQHAIYIAKTMEGIEWQPTDRTENIEDLIENITKLGTSNIKMPKILDLAHDDWPEDNFDCVFAANLIHILEVGLANKLIRKAPKFLNPSGFLTLYGPYRFNGRFTTPSNCNFDKVLRSRDPKSGIRDFEWILKIAEESGLTFVEKRSMPANNHFLLFQVK